MCNPYNTMSEKQLHSLLTYIVKLLTVLDYILATRKLNDKEIQHLKEATKMH